MSYLCNFTADFIVRWPNGEEVPACENHVGTIINVGLRDRTSTHATVFLKGEHSEGKTCELGRAPQ